MANAKTVLAAVRRSVKLRRTEEGERNAVAMVLSRYGYTKPPRVQQVADPERKTRRVYVWQGALGDDDLVLIAGPSYEGKVVAGSTVRLDSDSDDGITAWISGADYTQKGMQSAMKRATERGAVDPLTEGPKKRAAARARRAQTRAARPAAPVKPAVPQETAEAMHAAKARRAAAKAPATMEDRLKGAVWAVRSEPNEIRWPIELVALMQQVGEMPHAVEAMDQYVQRVLSGEARRPSLVQMRSLGRWGKQLQQAQDRSIWDKPAPGMELETAQARLAEDADLRLQARLDKVVRNLKASQDIRWAIEAVDLMGQMGTEPDSAVFALNDFVMGVQDGDVPMPTAAQRAKLGRWGAEMTPPAPVQSSSDNDAAMMAKFQALLKSALAEA
mgnify:CR=1 FL=1|jgi:hypothetical protein